MKRILPILCLSLFVVFAIGSISDAIEYNVTQLTDNCYKDELPWISDTGYVAWQAEVEPGNYEIFLYDGQTTKRLTDNSYNDAGPGGGPCVNADGHVAWNGQPGGSGTDLEIFHYNGSSTEQVTHNSYRDEQPQISDNGDIVWRGYDGSTYQVFRYDGSTAQVISSSSAGYPETNANGYVMWMGSGGGAPEIFLYNGTTTIQVTDNTYIDEDPHIGNNGQVAYVGHAGVTSAPGDDPDEIFVYDGSTSTRLTNNSHNDYQPDINRDGCVVWSGEVNVGPQKHYEILHYDGSAITQIAENKGGWGDPEISDNGFVAWQGLDPNNSSDHNCARKRCHQ
jgi:hypothetical protein